MSLSSFCRPACRSLIFPACHFEVKLMIRLPYCVPAAVIGTVPECESVKIFRNVAKCGSGFSSFERDDDTVEGTFRIPFENFASACVFVVRYFTSAHDWSRWWPPFGIPMIVPLM